MSWEQREQWEQTAQGIDLSGLFCSQVVPKHSYILGTDRVQLPAVCDAMVADFAAAIEWASLLERYAQRSSPRRRLPRVGMKTGLTAREKVTLDGRVIRWIARFTDN
ncbi:hypothetical protein [Burkholderia diffusa]|uniref:hypothetical protein n=1 Tax=Burkholderia diffusa TaxID=488732 RepID=UPI001582194D|nr:hypothetical protein [Burkholderia diffusa]